MFLHRGMKKILKLLAAEYIKVSLSKEILDNDYMYN
jgi:hypothetical protein